MRRKVCRCGHAHMCSKKVKRERIPAGSNLSPDLKAQRGYTNPKSKVYFDGREVLKGGDWANRKNELWERAKGMCEFTLGAEGFRHRCGNEGHDPDHIIKRSTLRDDRLSNLQLLCREHHNLKHGRGGGRKEQAA